MERNADINCVYIPSEDIVARVIEDELIIVPLAAGIADMEEELFTLNDTGKEIWNKLDGKKTLKDIAQELSQIYEAVEGDIETDVLGLVTELLKRKMLVEK